MDFRAELVSQVEQVSQAEAVFSGWTWITQDWNQFSGWAVSGSAGFSGLSWLFSWSVFRLTALSFVDLFEKQFLALYYFSLQVLASGFAAMAWSAISNNFFITHDGSKLSIFLDSFCQAVHSLIILNFRLFGSAGWSGLGRFILTVSVHWTRTSWPFVDSSHPWIGYLVRHWCQLMTSLVSALSWFLQFF